MALRREDPFGPHELYLGIDVGKSFHWAVALDPGGEVVLSRRVENRQGDVVLEPSDFSQKESD